MPVFVKTTRSLPVAGLLLPAVLLGLLTGAAQAQGVRGQAVVNLSFDEVSGAALDTATAGAAKDNGALVSNPPRIASSFPGQSGRQALVLDAATKQSVQIADSADLDRSDAVSVSLFFVNLHSAADEPFHGVFAKRDDAGAKNANYGINYSVKGDAFQVYVNDGSGFKTATYSTQAAVGYRRPVFITAVFEVGDAPTPDADEDKDDVLIRFFANGAPVTAKAATGGVVTGADVWLTDVKAATLINDAPLTLGSSTPALEHANCVIDEFSLFAKALSAEEAAALFVEVAGPNSKAELATIELAVPATPQIRELSLQGLQSGQTSVLAVSGANLLPAPGLVLPFAVERVAVRPGATAERVEFEVALPAGVAAGHYPLRVRNASGISGALTLAVDALPQAAYADSTPDKPVTLPIAISGTLTGEQQHRVYFAGKAGQRVVIDLECKRLGSAMDPVLELRNPRLAPLNIAWGKPQYRGDTRIEATLFADGVYSVDLHDLAYKAPGPNSYRLKIGDLKIVDTTFPPAVASGAQQTVAAIGPGMDPTTTLPVDMHNQVAGIFQPVNLPATLGVTGPAPLVVVSDAVETLEAAQPEGQLQTVDVRFAQRAHVPVVVNGRISRPGETDRYLLQVAPGMTLNLSVESHGIRSPLDARLLVLAHPDGSVLAASEERPTLDFAVPAGVSSVEVAVRDLNRRGGPDYVYRLRLIAAGQPDFTLSLDAERIALSRDGTVALRVDVNRAGYNGPIALALDGPAELSIAPTEIPAGVSKALLLLKSQSADSNGEALIRRARLIGQSTGLEPSLRRMALAPADNKLALVPAEWTELMVALAPASGTSVEVNPVPTVVFKGTEISLPVLLKRTDPKLAGQAARLTLRTTEAARTRTDNSNPAAPKQVPVPLVRSLPEQALAAGVTSGSIRVVLPLEIEEASIDAMIRVDFVPQPFSDRVVARLDSAPIRLAVQNAVTLQPAANALALAGKTETKLTGTAKRTAGFAQPVEIALVNLPGGYSAPKVTLAADQETFEIVVTAPEIAAAADLPNVALRVTATDGSPLLKDLPIVTKVTPGK
jgi:hypothetical protein